VAAERPQQLREDAGGVAKRVERATLAAAAAPLHARRARRLVEHSDDDGLVLKAMHRTLEPYWLYCEPADEALFTENESDTERLYGVANASSVTPSHLHRDCPLCQ
jgi:hypothetical protein